MAITTTFNFPIQELVQRGDKLTHCVKRDQEQFTSYGAAELGDRLLITTDSLREVLNDDYYEAQQKIATNQKAEARIALENELSDLRNRVKLAFGPKSIDFTIFNFQRLYGLNDTELLGHALSVVKLAEPKLEALAARQVTQANLDAIQSARIALDKAIDAQSLAVTNRRENTVARTELANKLYELVSEACDIGKIVWKGKNDAFYTDYLVYGSNKPMVEQAEEEEFTEEMV